MHWEGPYRGHELDRGFLDGFLSKGTPGVYLWRRVQRLDPESLTSNDSFIDWVIRGVNAPLLQTGGLKVQSDTSKGRLTVRPNYLQTSELSIGKGELGPGKREQLTAMSDDQRLALYDFLTRATIDFGPVVYVGESDCLLTRFSSHISSSSPLRGRMNELGLDLDDLALFYCSDAIFVEQTLRTLYEGILTHLLGAPLTFRAG